MESLAATGERTAPGLPREEYWFARHAAAYDWIRRRFADAGAPTVLDAGCGEGYGAQALRSVTGSSVIGLEYDPVVCAHIRRAYPDLHPVRANLAALPLRDACVDALACCQVIEHLWSLPEFLSECARVLSPGGLAIFTTPNRPVFSPGLGRGERPANPFHVEEFDAGQLRALLSDAGFVRVHRSALVSLAHSVVGEFNRSSPCLLTVPLASWSLIAGGCAGLQQQEDLKRGVWDGLGWRLLAWQPQTESAELVLEMESNSRDGGVRRAAFAVPLRGEPPQIGRAHV